MKMEFVPAMNVNILSHKYMNMYRFTALQPDPQMKFYFCFYDFSTFSLIVCSLSDLFLCCGSLAHSSQCQINCFDKELKASVVRRLDFPCIASGCIVPRICLTFPY